MNLFKRLWRLLFDYRFVECNTRKAFDAWVSWNPHLGFAFDFRIEFILPHKADPEDVLDDTCGLGVRFSLGLPWLDFGLNIPNDNWREGADCQLEVPKLYDLNATEYGTKAQSADGLLLGGDVRLVGRDTEGRPVPLDTVESD